MVGLAYCLISFIAAIAGVRKSLGLGLVTTLASGYLYGVVRGMFSDGFSQVGFDAALVGFYGAYFLRGTLSPELRERQREVMPWFAALMVWPVVVMLYSQAVPGAQTLIGQLAGLHAILLYFPMLLIGTHLRRPDLDLLARGLAFLNLVAFAFAAAEYVFGVDSVLPRNASTELVYLSSDVMSAGENYMRIPATFVSSHVYGFMMLMSIPLVAHGLETTKKARLLCIAGLIAAVLGIFVAGARSPVVCLAVATVGALITMRVRISTWAIFALLGAVVTYFVLNNERMQRFETAADPETLRLRFEGSVNGTMWNVLMDYPLGLGLAAAWGTNIPSFMQGMANPQIGFESEIARIIIDTGVIGFGIWVAFFVWATVHGDRSQGTPFMRMFLGPLLAMGSVSALIGVGVFSTIPSSAMILLMVGIRCASRPVVRPQLVFERVAMVGGASKGGPASRSSPHAAMSSVRRPG